jgi:hypothetical protein
VSEFTPIQLGEPIPGTDLVKRWQAGREFGPVYVGPEKLIPEALDKATDQALKAGYHGVVVFGDSYVFIDGEWYAFKL